MRLSARMTMIFSAVFALICLGFAANGFMSLGEISDATQLADAKGFAWFWAFLGGVAIVFGGLGWWLARLESRDENA